HDDIIVAGHLVESARQDVERALMVAHEKLVIGADHALGRLAQALAGRIVAGIGDKRADGLLGFFPRRARSAWAAADIDLRSNWQFLYRCVHQASLASLNA